MNKIKKIYYIDCNLWEIEIFDDVLYISSKLLNLPYEQHFKFMDFIKCLVYEGLSEVLNFKDDSMERHLSKYIQLYDRVIDKYSVLDNVYSQLIYKYLIMYKIKLMFNRASEDYSLSYKSSLKWCYREYPDLFDDYSGLITRVHDTFKENILNFIDMRLEKLEELFVEMFKVRI